MNVLTPLLLPFSALYGAVTGIRNRLYDRGLKPSVAFEVPLIGVGNLSVGGTGKTPMIEYLVRLLAAEYRVATLSRGYGRRSRGFRIAGRNDDALTVGDEPFQVYRKFGEKVVVAVGEERAMAVPLILDHHPETEVILLDDAFQHRRVRPAFQILLTDYNRLFVDDYILPAGRLRESRSGASRADVVVVTKCPARITDDEMMSIESSIAKYTPKRVFFTRICHRDILPAPGSEASRPGKVVLVTGIARPHPMIEYVAANFELVHHFAFRDHYIFSSADLKKISDAAEGAGAAVVTSEKDLMRMDPALFRSRGIPLQYIPIETEFLRNGKEFDEMVLNAVRSHAI